MSGRRDYSTDNIARLWRHRISGAASKTIDARVSGFLPAPGFRISFWQPARFLPKLLTVGFPAQSDLRRLSLADTR